MIRTTFLKLMLVATSMRWVPVISFSKKRNAFQFQKKGFKVAAGEGRLHGHIKLKGVNANILDLKISGTDSEDGIAVFEQTSLSRGKGTPLHIHYFQNEIFYVLEGNYFFKVGPDEFYLSPGECIFLPKQFHMPGRRSLKKEK